MKYSRLCAVGVKLGQKFFAVALTLAAVSGCSTLIVQKAALPEASSSERAGLIAAAADIAQTPWPRPVSGGVGGMLAAVIGDGDRNATEIPVSQDEAVDAYLAHLSAAGDPETVLRAEAHLRLAGAAALVAAAQEAARSASPSMADVSIVESAIADLRLCREIYLETAARLTSGASGRALQRELKSEFAYALRAVGDAADLLADRASEARSRRMATPGAIQYFAGAGS